MKVYESKDIRNVALLSHSGAGKTSLAEAFLFNTKATNRLGKVDDENSVLDFEPEEHKRRSTTKTSVACIEWRKTKLNIIDTPGDYNFYADTYEGMFAADAALLLVSAVDGLEVGTDRGWNLAGKSGRPVAILINKMDRERADFDKVLGEIREQLAPSAFPLHLPIGNEADFKGIVDLLRNKAFLFDESESGAFKVADVPPDMVDAVEEARSALVEGIAETSEELMEKYFEAGELTGDELIAGLQTAFRDGNATPVLCAAAVRNMGPQVLLDLIVDLFPSPVDAAPLAARTQDGEEVEVRPDADGPFAAYVFKTLVDPYTGQVTVARIVRGKMAGDGTFLNASTGEKERYSALNVITGKKLDTIASSNTGDIVALTKLKGTRTRQTITDENAPLTFGWLDFHEPVISFAIVPKTQSDEAKVSNALQRLLDEDVALTLSRDEQTKQFLLSGMGQVHIETTVDKLQRKFGVGVDLEPPKVPYRETVRKTATGIQGRHKKQTGGAGQFGEVYVDVSPGERGEGFAFEDKIVGGAIPRNFIPAVEKGFVESMERGFLAGFPVVDVKIRLYDGSYHSVDSSEMAFKTAAHIAFKNGMGAADPRLLEPIMTLDITVPEENMGDVMGDMNSRRGRVLGMDSKGRNQIIKAHAPLAEILRYALDLRSMTGGRGEFTMQFSHYEVVPDHIAQKVIEQRKAELEH